MHEGSGTVENMRGSHRSMNNAYAQTDVLFKPITTNPPIQTREVLTPEDEGTDPSLYSAAHDVLHGPAGTIFAFRQHHHLYATLLAVSPSRCSRRERALAQGAACRGGRAADDCLLPVLPDDAAPAPPPGDLRERPLTLHAGAALSPG